MAEQDEERRTVVLDNGSVRTRAGFAGDDAPRCRIPTVVAMHKEGPMPGIAPADAYAGDEAFHHRRTQLQRHWPVQEGIISNWDKMERLWHHTFFNELRCDPAEHAVLLSEQPDNPEANRQRAAEIMFETFGVQALSLQVSQRLALFSTGRTTGVVLDCGEHASRALVVVEGIPVLPSLCKLDIGGSHVTDRLRRLLGERFASWPGQHQLQELKHRHAYVALDYEAELQTDATRTYELPDGQQVSLGLERFQCTELLFQPVLEDKEPSGLPDLLRRAVLRCDEELRSDLWTNLVLEGGSMKAEGMAARMQQELPEARVRMTPPYEFGNMAWTGGSIVATLSTFAPVTRQEYAERGRCGPRGGRV